MLNNKNVLRILSLIIAVCLWVYVMGEVNPDTTAKINGIEVSFVNTDELADNGLAVVQEETITINATIKGKRSDVNETKNNGLVATVDVSGSEEGSNEADINLSLPSGVSLESISDTSIKFEVEEITEEEIPVEVEFTGNETAENGKEPWMLDVNPETITVRGAESSVERINCVRGSVAVTDVKDRERTIDVALSPVTEDGEIVLGIELETDTAQARVQLLVTKAVELEITSENLEDGFSVASLKGPDSVNLIGTEEALADLETVQGTVNLTGVTSGGRQEIILQLPEHVYLYNSKRVPTANVTLQTAD
ncbi:MAG: CdaR family protein [Bacillota bacterium]|nr:CdaR family protein [Bacillota bacterium]